jgi:hypothetical protein
VEDNKLKELCREQEEGGWDCDVEVWAVRLMDIPLYTAYEHKLTVRPGDH